MGLNISAGGDGFRAGNYSGFHKFRCWLANFENYDYDANSSAMPQDMLARILFDHSDCDGSISWKNATDLRIDLIILQMRATRGTNPREKLRLVNLTQNGSEEEKRDEEYYQNILADLIRICQRSQETEEDIEFS